MRKKQIIIMAIAMFLIVCLVLILSVFRVRSVRVSGSERYTSEEIESFIFHGEKDRNTILLWIRTKLGDMETIPFVEKYDVKISGVSSVEIEVYEKSVVGYFECMGSHMYFDKDGIIVETTDGSEEPKEPLITGLNFDYAVLHEKLPVENKETFSLLLNVTQLLKKYEISIDRLYLSEDMQITLYKGKVRIELGANEKMAEKLNDLKGFQDTLSSFSGTLDMTIYKEDGSGYVLKRDDYAAEEEETGGQE